MNHIYDYLSNVKNLMVGSGPSVFTIDSYPEQYQGVKCRMGRGDVGVLWSGEAPRWLPSIRLG